MKLIIHAHHLEAPEDLRPFLEKHFMEPLTRLYDDSAAQLTVYVQDTKPGKGGVDQACKVSFRMPNARSLRVEAVATDLHASLLECSHRLKRLVQREMAKQRAPGRDQKHNPLGRSYREEATSSGEAPDGTPSTL